MEHFWRSIEGYCTFPDFYAWVAKQVPDKAKLCEVGCWKGQSAALLLVELANQGKLGCELYLVDTFTEAGASIDDVYKNLDRAPHELEVEFCCGRSVEVAKGYADGFFDFVFIDADHTYEAAKADIAAWLPKVKPGGILAGHDFKHFPSMGFGVIEAVTEAFDKVEIWRGINDGGNAQMIGTYWPCWSYRVPA